MKMRARFLVAAFAVLLGATASAQMSAVRVSVDASRSKSDTFAKTDAAVRLAASNMAKLSATTRTLKARYNPKLSKVPIAFPMVVHLTKNGQDLTNVAKPMVTPGGINAITLSFDSSGAGAFPSGYQTFLQNVFASAQSTMNLIFGPPSASATIHVANFDATIGDRQAVAGGYFVPGSGATAPEIRFPVYSNQEATAVNFIHTLLLAYLGNDAYTYDGFQEGLVRAAVMKIVRTPGALPVGLDSDLIETVLQNTYDVGGFYDWYNQPGLTGPTFISPNLINTPLPSGGSVGGPYLLKYRMGGSAWLKVLAQYPTFIANLNQRLYFIPTIGANPGQIISAGQAAINEISGSGSATVEGMSLAEWAKRQYILHVNVARGQKLLVEPTPITSDLSGSDFGVYLIETHYFSTSGANQETLLSGTSFPIFWEGDRIPNRIFPSAQEDQMDIAGAYGAVTPNFPNLNSGAAYRVTTDIPVGDQLERVYLPAGSVATASNQTPNNFFGTVESPQNLPPAQVQVSIGSTVIGTAPVVNGAFGISIANSAFQNSASLNIRLTVGTIQSNRIVNKGGPGPLALDLRYGEATVVPNGNLHGGLTAPGISIQPWLDYEPYVLGTTTTTTQVARFNPSKAAYDLFPEIESFRIGHAYFLEGPKTISPPPIVGRTHPGMAMSVALKPGWNLITVPQLVSVPLLDVQVVHSTNFPVQWSDAVGTDIGTDFFQFVPGPTDPNTNWPETGAFEAVTDGTFRSGNAYFVRVLDPEGVVLNFELPPAVLTGIRSAIPAAQTAGWQMTCQVVGAARSSKAIIGESPVATDKFDPKLDSGLPPGMGGLQIAINGTERMYRDIRKQGLLEESFKLHMEGLVPGQKYSLKLSMLKGAIPYCTISDPDASYRKPSWPPSTYIFTAKNSTRDITIITPGGIK